jgi:DNA-directed RNA polymerase subunit RPC12/RpoP
MGPLAWSILVALAVLAAAGYLYGYRRPDADSDEGMRFRCQSCGQRLRFRKRQAGRRVMCSHCFQLILHPTEISQALSHFPGQNRTKTGVRGSVG